MRKSTLVALVILVLALVGVTVLLKVYTDQFAEEIKQAKAMTAAFAADLAPDSTIKLARVHGTNVNKDYAEVFQVYRIVA